nr:MarR family transcriptional regulator [Asticcacaulis aquaticus]
MPSDTTELAARFQNLATRLLRQARVLDGGSAITSAQYAAMSTLYTHPGIPLTELAALEKVAHPTMSRLVNALIGLDMVARTPHPTDKRTVSLSLTAAGRAAYERVYARRLALMGALLARLKPETVADLIENLDAWLDPKT